MKYEFAKNDRFLITGGAGFIGSNIVKYLLANGYYVRVVDNYITGKKENIEEFFSNPNFDFLEGDICDYETCKIACENIDYVLHQAALGSVPRSVKNPLLSNSINVDGFLNMLYASKENKVKKFIYASSSSVYGDSVALPKKEGEEGVPLSPYAATKKINEIYAQLFYKLYHLPTIGLRYFNVYGPKQDPKSIYAAVIPIFITKLINNEAAIIDGDGTNSRDFTFIKDVIDANIKACLCDKKHYGKVYNIGYGEKTTIYELYMKISNILSKTKLPIYGQKREGDVPHSHASIENAKQDLCYIPKYNIDEGLKETINWYTQKKN